MDPQMGESGSAQAGHTVTGTVRRWGLRSKVRHPQRASHNGDLFFFGIVPLARDQPYSPQKKGKREGVIPSTADRRREVCGRFH